MKLAPVFSTRALKHFKGQEVGGLKAYCNYPFVLLTNVFEVGIVLFTQRLSLKTAMSTTSAGNFMINILSHC